MNPFEFVPHDIIPKLSNIKPYTIVLLKKGIKYEYEDARKIIQSEHLPYIFDLREKGIIAVSMPINDSSENVALGIYNLNDKDEVIKLVQADPAVKSEVFAYEVLTAMGLPGDTLA
jgi:uncharacterized protein YciI